MTKNEYLLTLGAALKKSGVGDAEDILEEYEQHFAFKAAEGYAESEIAAKLEPPEDIAAHYSSIKSDSSAIAGVKTGIKIAMGILAVFETIACVLFFCWIAVIAAASVALLATGASLIIGVSPYGLIPDMPVLSAIIHGLCVLSLGLVLGSGACVCLRFLGQVILSGKRRHAIATGKTALPPLPWIPPSNNQPARRLKSLFLIALVAFGVSFVLAYIIAALQAGALEYWHEWGWFV